jgi:hypothetical protein
MYTLSITEAKQKLSETVSNFEGVTAYKVEFGMWDHTEKPYIQLYVNVNVNGQNQFIHAQGNTFFHAMQELKAWYNELAKQELVIVSQDLLL